MKRKVIKQGNGTLTITLPKQWTKDINLTGNSEVEITNNENNLIISPASTEKEKTISINVDNFERLSFAKFLIACYEQGFDTMDLVFSKSIIKSWSHGEEGITDVITFFVSRLIGFEVLSQTKNSVKIGNIAKEHMKFESILSRIFFLIEEYLRHLIESNNPEELTDRESRHDNITKMIALSIREIYESNALSKIEALNLTAILNMLDKVTDFIRYSYKNATKPLSKETISLAKKTLKFLDLYRSFFNKFSYKAINQLDELRGEIKNQNITNLKKHPAEASVNSQFDALVETLHGAIKPRISIEIEKGIR
ncbi:hypothetical protein GF361_01225 [Candidatus Woesearchaeota archaeon]|nr:hypothetical protein [Candidatus Woesearchaeota archaeon]